MDTSEVVACTSKGSEEDRCPLCQRGPETVEHAIWGCRWVRNIWKLAGFGDVVKDIRGEDAISIFMKAMHSKEVRKFDFFVALVWEIYMES